MHVNYKTDSVPYAAPIETNLVLQLLGLAGLNSFVRHNSSPRQAMMSKQIGQMQVVSHPDVRRIQSGIDREFGRYTHQIRFDSDSIVLKTISKYPNQMRMQNIKSNSLVTVIYENLEDDRALVDVKNIPTFHSLHQQFGFDYKLSDNFSTYIRDGGKIPGGTIIANSPNVDKDGNYRFGVSAKVAFTSSPSGIEDGIKVSEEFLEKLKIHVYDTRTIQFGTKKLPLNIHGNDTNFKIIPDVGECIGDNGVLAVLRDFDVNLAPCDLTVEAMQSPNTFDEYIYAHPGAEIVDIKIVHNKTKNSIMLTNMEEQLEKYLFAQNRYNEELVKFYKKIMKESNGRANISHELHKMISDAMAMIDDKHDFKFNEKNNKLDNWALTVTFKYQLKADVGFKLTDLSGGKGVICTVVPKEQMLMDADGNIADIEMDADSVIKRMNLAKLFEQYVNAAGAATTKRIREMVINKTEDEYLKAWDYILGFYKLVSPKMYELIGEAKIDPITHINNVMENGIYLWIPTDNPIDHLDMVRLLQIHYPPCYGPCTYTGQTGKKITTKNPILIGEVHFILLDKIANSFSSVSSARLQHYGLPAKPTKRNKYSDPTRTSPIRSAGESEVRLFVNVAGGNATADLLDRSSNPLVHQQIVRGILNAPEPTNIYNYVDRSVYPIGQGSILNLTNHILQCGGVQFDKGDISDDVKYNRY